MNEICPDVGSGGSFLCGVRASVGAAFRAGAGRVGSPGGLCYSALTRRGDIPHYRIENSAPAKGCVWPVLAPARAWVRAGAGRRGWDSECGIRNWGAGMSVSGDAVLAGRFSSVCARHCGSDAFPRFASSLRGSVADCPRFETGFAFWRGVWHSVYLSLWVCRSVCLGSRLLFDAQRQTGRLAICSVPVPQVESAIRAFSMCRRGYRAWLVHFGIVCLFAAISTGCRGRGDGAGGAALVRLCAAILTLLSFPRGVRWG